MKWKSSATVLKSGMKDGFHLGQYSEMETTQAEIDLPGHDNKYKAIKRNVLQNVNRVIPGISSRLLGVQSFKNFPFIRTFLARDKPASG